MSQLSLRSHTQAPPSTQVGFLISVKQFETVLYMCVGSVCEREPLCVCVRWLPSFLPSCVSVRTN